MNKVVSLLIAGLFLFDLQAQESSMRKMPTDTLEVEEDTVIISATRFSRSIANTSTRLEVISGEELSEKGNMKPGDIRMILNESTGIQTQQTSPTSYNAGIRIQGLEGRYTQLLRDGYPLYSGFSGGLSLLQIAPLDLKQVEVIKGAASTLYGGGAIAGIVNLVSKTPGNKRQLNFLTNVTSAGGLDVSGFYSEKVGTVGMTVFGSRNSNRPFDPASIGFTAIPKFERYTFNPRIFFYKPKTTLDVGISYVGEKRLGGSMEYIKNSGRGFFEKNLSDRFTTQFGIVHQLDSHLKLSFKNSLSSFHRLLSIPSYSFHARQLSSFSELTLTKKGKKLDWIFGSNFITEQLAEKGLPLPPRLPKRDYLFKTSGVFVQQIWTIHDQFIIESGLRGDYVKEFGFELLPRLSLLYKPTTGFTTRLGGGFGYKTPTIFTEEAERRQFQQILPIDLINARNERSLGFNWDINYSTTIGGAALTINQLFYYTRLNSPLVLESEPGGLFYFNNASGYLDTRGIETNVRIAYKDFKLFIGYTLTDVTTNFNNRKSLLPLTAKHRLNNVLMYELEEKLKIGLEAYYFSKQRLSDGSEGRSYWITGLMAERLWEKFSVFVNFENFTDTRQTKFATIYAGTINNPVFKDIYAPLDGFVINGGVKISL